MIPATGDVRALVYAPYSFSGRGPAELAQIAGGMAAAGLRTEVHAGRARTPCPRE